MSIVRWGLLSTARINRRVIPAIRASKRGDLLAVASREQNRAQSYAIQWKIPLAFSSYQAMLESDQVDAIYISLPNHLHAEWSIRAMRAGKHVLCEKPIALSLSEIDQMIQVSQETGCVLAEAFMYRHHPQTKMVGNLVRTGQLGEILAVHGVFTFTIDNPQDVRLNSAYGGGCLWDIGIYPISYTQFIFGRPPSVVSGFQYIGNSGVDEVFAGQLFYSPHSISTTSNHPNFAQFIASFRAPLQTQIEVVGSEGRLTIHRPFNKIEEERHIFFYHKNGKLEKIRVPKEYLYQGEIEDMHAAILDGQPTHISLQESRDLIRTVQALKQSAVNRQTATL